MVSALNPSYPLIVSNRVVAKWSKALGFDPNIAGSNPAGPTISKYWLLPLLQRGTTKCGNGKQFHNKSFVALPAKSGNDGSSFRGATKFFRALKNKLTNKSFPAMIAPSNETKGASNEG